MTDVNVQYYLSPCGELVLACVGDELCLCDWKSQPCACRNMRRLERLLGAQFREAPSPVLDRTKKELDEYFAGRRTSFDIPIHPVGTPFQMSVWKALLEIPFGETGTYLEVARKVNNAKGVRAVAQAIGANGIAILIPCHRVIGTNHSLTGFAGGLAAKRTLLQIEGVLDEVPI